MSFEDDYSFSMEDIPGTEEYNERMEKERYGKVKYIEDGYVKKIDYCRNCGSIDIKISKAGKKYCSRICWKPVDL